MLSVSKLKNNVVLTTLFFTFTVLSHLAYVYIRAKSVDSIPLENYIYLYLCLLVFSFISQVKLRFIAMGFLLILAFFQFMSLEFYGVPVYPAEILLLFSQQGEIWGTLLNDLMVFLFPVGATIIPLVILYKLNKKYNSEVKSRYTFFLFVIGFLFHPLNTFVTGDDLGKKPSENNFEGANIYYSVSYFLGHIIPQKMSPTIKPGLDLEFKSIEPFEGDIILVLGESLTPSHMSLFGYKRKTTPFLDSIKDDLFFETGYSASVSSDVSIAFFMNNTYGDFGATDVRNADKCLFKLAKDSGFHTSFYSTQSRSQLKNIFQTICPESVMDLKSIEDLDPKLKDLDRSHDILSLNYLKTTSSDKKRFTILHQRGSHSPYNKRFTKKSDVFKSKLTDLRPVRLTNNYDNSVIEFDNYMQSLYEYVNKLDRKTIVLYVSDHGEGLGEDGIWGHGKLNKVSSTVPIIGFSNFDYQFDFGRPLNHLNISLFLTELFGYQGNIESRSNITNYMIYGNEIDGFAGQANPRDI